MEKESASSSGILDGQIEGIRFGLASHQQICIASISDCPINHTSQLSNPFLGLPLEFGKCESCGASEPGQCEGHFGYIELPVPIYHPSHVSELKRLLSSLCLKCLKIKRNKGKNGGLAERILASCCEDTPPVSVTERKADNGACYLVLKLPSRSMLRQGRWSFLQRYGYRYDDGHARTLLPREVLEILRRIPVETRKKLVSKGFFPQEGYILQYLPVPPNCLSVPDVSDGVRSMSQDPSRNELKDVLRKVETIRSSRSKEPNFESHRIEANDLYIEVDKYLQIRGTAKASRNIDMKFGLSKGPAESSTKAWLEKMRTLFIRKGSGFSSRCVITGDAYKRVNEVGIPYEIAQRITFQERVCAHNIRYLQDLVDNKMCLTFTDGSASYSLKEGSKGHTFLRPGQVVQRRIMDGDTVFINRPPTTHKHSLQALRVYVHEDSTVKINPLICGPLSADFDGDCAHLFYPQSLAARAEVVELFSVEKQLLSSHNGQLNLQLGTDALLSIRVLCERLFLDKAAAQQLALCCSVALPPPALWKTRAAGPLWTALQILQLALPECLTCKGDGYLISESELLYFDLGSESIPAVIAELVACVFLKKGPKQVLNFFDSLQPFLMEHLFDEGFSVSLEDFYMSKADMRIIQSIIQEICPLVSRLRLTYEDELQLENSIQRAKGVAANFMLKSYSLRNLIDIRSNSSITKLVQQIGFLGLQLSDKKKLYSKNLVEDMAAFYHYKYPGTSLSAEFGLVKGCFFHGLDPYEGFAHAIYTREVIVRSSRGLAEPGTLFKNLMAALRDIVICYDDTVRNACSNSVVQFRYGGKSDSGPHDIFSAGEPVGVLAATAMSTPAYKAVLDSTPNSNSSWEHMKDILQCKVSFQNAASDRRVTLYLNRCRCGKKFCQENAACIVKNQLKKISLKDTGKEFLIEYRQQQTISENFGLDACLVGHIHLDKMLLEELDISMSEILEKCQETVHTFGKSKKKKNSDEFKRTILSVSECCTFQQSCTDKDQNAPCLMFSFHNATGTDLETTVGVLSNTVYPVLLETVVKGDQRISSANIVWSSPEMMTWIRNPRTPRKGEWVLDIVVEKTAVKKSGDAWRTVVDSCIPVLHLIDTKRTITYAIKQLQEMLGISCAFEQAVQRLSASVKMVSKGVLKEHLILLANCMTCSGNLVGFNPGGYKALTRSLNIQAPFTEATLIAPRKCFEKAAEKCHSDTLSSVVGSCSWGKQVAVGTGSRFELLWNQKEADLSKEENTDVYSFLNMVKGGANGEAEPASSLGFDVDDFIPEAEMAEWADSPENDSALGKLVFEDSADFQDILDEGQPMESTWEKASGKNNGFMAGGSAWECVKDGGGDETTKSGGWEKATDAGKEDVGSGWNSNKSDIQESSKGDNGWGNWEKDSVTTKEDIPSSDNWGSKKISDEPWGQQNETRNTTQESSLSAWDQPKKDKQNEKQSWGAVTESDPCALSQPDVANDEKNENSWVSATKSGSDAWNKPSKEDESQNQRNSWGSEKVSSHQAWDQPNKEDENQNKKNPWASTKESSPKAWKQQGKEDEGNPWGLRKESSSLAWNKPSSQDDNQDNEISGGIRDKASSPVWNKPSTGGDAGDENPWVSRKESSSAWTPSNTQDGNDANPWGSKKESSSPAWDKPRSQDGDKDDGNPWGSKKDSSSPVWNKPSSQMSNQDDENPWSSRKKFQSDGSQGWNKGGGEWKGKLNRPARSPGIGREESGLLAMFTVTRQRLDMFTTEEQDMLADVESLMKSIRKIMHQSGYNDGDPVSADDQAFVLDKVLSYHPDKASKIGGGVDYVMVGQHSLFQDTRCFHIVSTDGTRHDFSYRKCLDNLIREKYPELADEFIGKYFRPPRSGGRPDRKSLTQEVNDNPASEIIEKPTEEATTDGKPTTETAGGEEETQG